MTWTRERVRKLLFALTLVALPWQTRWFSEGPSLGGYPWEQGRISIYASSLLIAWGVILSLSKNLSDIQVRPSPSVILAKARIQRFFNKKTVLLVVAFALVLLHSISYRATFEWALEWLMLLGLVWTAFDLRFSRKEIVFYFTLAIIPSALLGIWQYLTQVVVGSKWLGIATQLPATLGVSVIEVGSTRVLRAYGTFPHPNILGGWLAVGILGIVDQLRLAVRRYEKIFFFASLVIYSIAIVLTFSRGAWLALIGGGLVYTVLLVKESRTRIFQQRTFLYVAMIAVATVTLTGYMVRDRIFVRIHAQTRLEERSIDERALGLKNGWEVFKQQPWLGSGPGTMNLAIAQGSTMGMVKPPVPPHFIFITILAEGGIVGAGCLSALGYGLFKKAKRSVMQEKHKIIWSGFAIVLMLGGIDHFLWSFFSGKALLVILGLIFLL